MLRAWARSLSRSVVVSPTTAASQLLRPISSSSSSSASPENTLHHHLPPPQTLATTTTAPPSPPPPPATTAPTTATTAAKTNTNTTTALDFDNPREAYRNKPTSEIIRSLFVFKACQQRWLVNNADLILSKSKSIFGASLVNWTLKHTFYRQFVAGVDAADIQPILQRLRASGVGAVLDYAAEDDVEADEGAASRQPPTDTVIGRTYTYENEAACDTRMKNFLMSIKAARSPDNHPGFTAIKVTALGLPKLLERVSRALLAVRSLFEQLDENGDGFLEPEEFFRVYRRLFLDCEEVHMQEVFDYLDTDRDGRVDYVAFTKGITLKDGAEIASRFREQDSVFARAALTHEELRLLDNMVQRVDTLAESAAKNGVRLLIDAEHSYFQPAIDAVAAQLQLRHNIDEPRIYNTYQCYLRDVHARMAADVERARRGGYKFGCKLVRGAYMVLERQRAEELRISSPIWDTKQETDAAYDSAVAAMMPLVKSEGAEVMVASHNQASVEKAVGAMVGEQLAPSSGVSFGQLLGMADHLTFTLGARGYGAYKYTPFGGIEEVIPYLLRRAQENSDMILGGVGTEVGHLKNELKRRRIF